METVSECVLSMLVSSAWRRNRRQGCRPGQCQQKGHVPCHPRRCSAPCVSLFLVRKGQLLLPAVFLSTRLHAGLTFDVSMAMGLDYIKCLDSNITVNTSQWPLHEAWQTPWVLDVSALPHAHRSLRSQAQSAHCSSSLTSRAAARVPPGPTFQHQHQPHVPQQPAGAESWARRAALTRSGCCSHLLPSTHPHLPGRCAGEVHPHVVPSQSSGGSSCGLAV